MAGTAVTARDVERDTAAVVGGKLGYWFDAFPYVGAELDASHHDPDAPAQTVSFSIDGQAAGTGKIGRIDLSVTSVALNVLARWPRHRVQPYIGAGPAVFFTRLKDTGKGGASIVIPSGQDDSDTKVGVQVVAGVRFFATSRPSPSLPNTSSPSPIAVPSDRRAARNDQSEHDVQYKPCHRWLHVPLPIRLASSTAPSPAHSPRRARPSSEGCRRPTLTPGRRLEAWPLASAIFRRPCLSNDKVLIVGFPTPELYDPVAGTFVPTGTTEVSIAHGPLHTATLLEDGRVLIVGGTSSPGLRALSRISMIR